MGERQLPPWEEITYFNDPVITTVNVAGGGMIVDRNPQRVVLIITINGGTGVQIAPQPFKSSPVGYALTATSPNVIWTEADHATLCTCAWYLSQSAAVTLTVMEVILRQWPDEGNI